MSAASCHLASTTLVELEGVGKSYGATQVLAPTDLSLLDGEFLTVLGPSGSGKTTILRMIAGLSQPTAGRILLDGRDIATVPPFRRPFNTVFQDYALFPHMKVRDNVGYGLRMRGVDRSSIDARVRDVLEVVELADKADRYPAALSGGQRQRVALARAIVCEPRLVLLDEPLAALDASLRHQMQMFLKSLQQRIRTSFLLVTHDQEEAMAVSDRIVVMSAGRIEQIGSPTDLYHHPHTRFVAGFFGDNNILAMDRVAQNPALNAMLLGDGKESDRSAWVAVRPERLTLRTSGEGVLAQIERCIFLGPVTEAIVRIKGPTDIDVRVRMPSDLARPWLSHGGPVRLHCRREDVSLLGAD